MIPLKKVADPFLQQTRDAPLVALFLDYDGTLCPIQPHPELAILKGSQKILLERLYQLPGVFLCIVSGRDLSDLRRIVGIPEIPLVGNHGATYHLDQTICYTKADTTASLDIDELNQKHSERESTRGNFVLEEFEKSLERQFSGIRGVQVEKKIDGIAIHYRNVPDSDKPKVYDLINQTMEYVDEDGFFQIQKGKMLVEIRPKHSPTKGHAVRKLLCRLRREKRIQPLSIFFGDDLTDESAFDVVSKENGWPILVNESIRRSAAKFLVHSPNEVHEWLEKLLEIRLHP